MKTTGGVPPTPQKVGSLIAVDPHPSGTHLAPITSAKASSTFVALHMEDSICPSCFTSGWLWFQASTPPACMDDCRPCWRTPLSSFNGCLTVNSYPQKASATRWAFDSLRRGAGKMDSKKVFRESTCHLQPVQHCCPHHKLYNTGRK